MSTTEDIKGTRWLKVLSLLPVFWSVELLASIVSRKEVGISDFITAALLFVTGLVGAIIAKKDRTAWFGFKRKHLIAISCTSAIAGTAVLLGVVFRVIPLQ